MKKIFAVEYYWIILILLISPLHYGQPNYQYKKPPLYNSLYYYSLNQQSSLKYFSENSKFDLSEPQERYLNFNERSKYLSLTTSRAEMQNLSSDDFQPWESEKHFGIAVSELVIVQLLPWVRARYITTWEDPADNWAVVGFQSWWRNIQNGWSYDNDEITTNNFAHPYHGNLYFNVGRTNGYDFWESLGWSLAGSTMWEFFGENTFPAINDWVYTGIGGANLGEITYRLSSLVTDNNASGSERLWSEIFGALINPVRGLNRAISGEMGQSFPNPEWSRPEDLLITLDAGTRSVDKNGDKQYRDNELDGIFGLNLYYGNRFEARKPFDFFKIDLSVSSGTPHFTHLNTSGYLFGYDFERNKHRFNVNLDFNYNNLIEEETTETDTIYNGFLYGTTQLYPHILSRFPIGERTSIVTRIGINTILMGATPNDYFRAEEGRIYDFGPGLGTRIVASIYSGIWNYLKLLYYNALIWTQSEPSDSKHFIQILLLTARYPLTSFFSVGVSAGLYFRE